jgi:hypothetical protein
VIPDTLTQEQIHWHLLRYDGLRGSVAARASYVLSANALVLAGTGLAIGQITQHEESLWLRIAALVVIAVLLSFVATSIWASIGAFTTFRAKYEQGLRRGIYGWSTAEAVSKSYGAFVGFLGEHDAVQNAQSELYLVIRQIAHRYGRLRWAMLALLGGLASFVVLTGLAASASLL